MPGLIPTLTITRTPSGVRVTCSHCPHEELAPHRPAADAYAIGHERAHLLGLITHEED